MEHTDDQNTKDRPSERVRYRNIWMFRLFKQTIVAGSQEEQNLIISMVTLKTNAGLNRKLISRRTERHHL